MKVKPLISVIIVSYNTEDETLEAVKSVRESKGFSHDQIETIVVDNASTDNTVDKLESEFPEVILIKNLKNRGFGPANNQGIKEAKGKYVLLLNSDAFLGGDSLSILKTKLDADPQLIAVGPQLRFDDGTIQQSAGYIPTLFRVMAWMYWWDRIPVLRALFRPYHAVQESWYTKERHFDWLMGACILFRKEGLLEVGGFDEKIFMYAEEVELFIRLNKLGKKVLFTPETKVTHLGGLSTDKAKTGKFIKELEGLEYIYQKHFPWQFVPLSFILYTGIVLRVIIFNLIPSKKGHIDEYKKYLRVF